MVLQRFGVLVGLFLTLTSTVVVAAGDDAQAHHAPVLIRIYYRDGRKRDAILVAQSLFANAKPRSAMTFHTSTGDVTLYMDMISTVSEVHTADDVNDSSALFKFSNGSARRLKFGGSSEKVVLHNADGTREVLDLTKIVGFAVANPQYEDRRRIKCQVRRLPVLPGQSSTRLPAACATGHRTS